MITFKQVKSCGSDKTFPNTRKNIFNRADSLSYKTWRPFLFYVQTCLRISVMVKMNFYQYHASRKQKKTIRKRSSAFDLFLLSLKRIGMFDLTPMPLSQIVLIFNLLAITHDYYNIQLFTMDFQQSLSYQLLKYKC